jgi:hypothetical protein
MKNEGFDQLRFARRIRRAGRPIHIPEDDGDVRYIPSAALRVYQTGFKINLVVTSTVSGFAVSRIELKLPWEHTHVQWLEDPNVTIGSSRCYRFFGHQTLEIERELVLNHRLKVTRLFSIGESVEGLLLGIGSEPIPEEFPQGRMIPALVLIYDQIARQYQAPVKLWADRSTRNTNSAQVGAMREGQLLDKLDKIV